MSNPIILKEMVQAARHRRMFLVRAALPTLAVLLTAPEMMRSLRFAGQDWRAIADIGRPFFETCAWIELIAFSVLAYLYPIAAIGDEWSSRTMEVLCASPLSAARIVYGKFVAVLSRVLLVGLALLPVMGILFHVARVPPEMALGCVAVILGSALFFGSAGLLQAILFGTGRAAPLAWFGILAPFFLIVSFLDAYVFEAAPALDAMIPPRALYLLLNGSGSGNFSLLSLGELSALSLICLGLAPRLFRRAFERHIGRGAPTRWFPTFKRLLQRRRPPMGAAENPLFWQEKASATWLLRWALPIVYGFTLPFLAMSDLVTRNRYDDASIFLAMEGIAVLFAASAGYGATVFARDKKWGRAQALLLTGRKPWAFLGAKIRAVYWALKIYVLVVSAICLWAASYHSGDRETPAIRAMLIEMAFFGPLAGVIIGMAFSLAARYSTSAVLGALGSVLWAIAIGWMLFGWLSDDPGWGSFAMCAGAAAGIMATRLRRSIWALSALLALSFWIVVIGAVNCVPLPWNIFRDPYGIFYGSFLVRLLIALCVTAVIGIVATRLRYSTWALRALLALSFWIIFIGSCIYTTERDLSHPCDTILFGSLLAWLLAAGWLLLDLRCFEAGMMQEAKS